MNQYAIKDTFLILMSDDVEVSLLEQQIVEYLNSSIPDDPIRWELHDEVTENLEILLKWYVYKKLVEKVSIPKKDLFIKTIVSLFTAEIGSSFLLAPGDSTKKLAYFYWFAIREGKLKPFNQGRIYKDMILIADTFKVSSIKFKTNYYRAEKEHRTEYRLRNSILAQVKKLP
jgi:hypothetical protein